MAVNAETAGLDEELSRQIEAYFDDCAARERPATPAGLALALDMRTADLQKSRPYAQAKLIDRALQRIEAAATEQAMMTKSSMRGIELVLQQAARPEMSRPYQHLTDDELYDGLRDIYREMRRIPQIQDIWEEEDE